MAHLFAFIAGVREFRLSFTTHYEDMSLSDAYDRGREFAHKMTFRRYDE